MSVFSSSRYIVLVGAIAVLSGCMTPPPTIVKQPLSARPGPQMVPPPTNGAIFQAQTNQGLFGDRFPSQIGDLLTVIIEERASVSSSENSTGSRTATATASAPNFSIPFFPNYLERGGRGLNINLKGEFENEGTGSSSATSSFNTNITVMVTEILPNGHLQVSGEKQVRMNGDMQFIRLSGIVNPRDIRADGRLGNNVVSSLRMADAKIEQVNRGNNNLFAQPGWLTRFFMTVLPF